MLIKKYTTQLLNLIKYAEKDKDLELEVLIKENTNITNSMFNNVIKRLKGYSLINKVDQNELLDIFFKDNDFRVTIYGSENINSYCLTNDINNIDSKFIQVIKKSKVQYTDVHEYKLRFNLKRENINIKSKQFSNIAKGHHQIKYLIQKTYYISNK